MRTNRGYLFNVYYSKGVSYCHLGLAETQRQAREHKSFIVKKKKKEEKKEDFRCASEGGCWHEEAGVWLTRSRCHLWLVWEYIGLFFQLVLSCKQGQKIGKLTVTDQFLTVLGQLTQKFWVLVSHMVWALSICVFSLLSQTWVRT